MARGKTKIREKLRNLSLRNKIFLLILALTFLPSVGVAYFTAQLMVSGRVSRLEQRALEVARSIEKESRDYILNQKGPELAVLLRSTTRLSSEEPLIFYVGVVDKEERVLARTFRDAFPENLPHANRTLSEAPYTTADFQMGEYRVRDIALPIKDGDRQLGAVHVGLNMRSFDALDAKLAIPLVGIISPFLLVFLGIGYGMSRYITRPISRLTKMSDEISRGNLDIDPEIKGEVRCWEIRQCGAVDCPAYDNTDQPCWYIDDTHSCGDGISGFFLDKREVCQQCDVYQKNVGDEYTQLTHSLRNMIIRLKRSEQELRESEAKYRSLFDSGPNPMFVLDKETLEILDANPSAEKTYGYTREELVGRPFTDLGKFAHAAGGSTGQQGEDWREGYAVSQKVRHHKKGNTSFYVNIHSCPMRYGEREAIIVAATDVTEMMEKEAQLIQASKMTSLGQMSAGIAHELNQPLNAIRLGNDFLKKMAEDRKEIPEQTLLQVANEVRAQVDRAASIINRLREFGRKADFARDRVDINGPVREVFAIIGQQLNLQDIRVNLDLEEGLPPVLAHNNRLEQVIFNLVTNAKDAINEKKDAGPASADRLISVRTRMEGDRVRLAISDTGLGIPAHRKEKIFEPFFTTKETGKGMGLGLSIVYGIVKDYEGDIHVESREGEGTTFTLSFPRAPE